MGNSESSENEGVPPNVFQRFQECGLWEVILDYVTDPLNMASLSGTCPTFQNKFKDKLMTEILQVVKKNNFLVSNRGYLPLRRVSKSWKALAESVFMNELGVQDWHLNYLSGRYRYRRLPEGEDLIDSWSSRSGRRRRDLVREHPENEDHPNFIHLSHPEQVDQVMSIVEGSSSDSRAAVLQLVHVDEQTCSTAANLREFHSKICEFLDMYGEWIEGLHLTFSNTRHNLHMYQVLMRIVTKVPRIKALVLRRQFEHLEADSFYCSFEELDDYIRSHPFPIIGSLELLKFDYWVNFDEESGEHFVPEILRKVPNVKSLSMPKDLLTLELEETFEVMRSLGDNLRLEHYHCHWNRNKPSCPLAFVSWPLRKITSAKYDLIDIPLHTLCRFLNRFSGTLEHLEWFNDYDPYTFRPCHRLELPHLKTLCFGNVHARKNGLNFLINLTSLEYLEFDHFRPGNSFSRKHRIFGEYEGDLNHDNVWQLCRRLKEIKIEYSSWPRNNPSKFKYIRP